VLQFGKFREGTREILVRIRDLDFRFENSPVKIIANKNYPEIQLAGLSVGPFEEGNEYEIYYWIATKLVEADIAHFREDNKFGASELYKVQWKERVQVAGQISELPEEFYPKLRRYLADMKKNFNKEPEKITEHNKAMQLALDIVNARLKKTIALSSVSAQNEQMLKKMTTEERLIYDQLGNIIAKWRKRILEHKEQEKA
jgi:hypothetical protein